MPTYEYRCERCGHGLEVVQSFAESSLTTCESCGGPLRKVYAPVGIVFKGSGFYKTDSRSSSKAASGTSATPTSSDGGGAEKSTEKKDAKEPKKADAATSPANGSSGSSAPAKPPAASGSTAKAPKD